MRGELLLRGGRVIDPRHQVDRILDVLVRDGHVAQVAERVEPKGARVLDVTGKWVVPGFIDLHVHLREPGEERKETILTGCRAAASGGFTAVVAMPNTKVVNDSPMVTGFVLSKAQEANLCRVYPAGAITRGLEGESLTDFGALQAAGCVCLTDDGRPLMSAALMRRALQWSSQFGLPVMVHEEDLSISAGGAMTEGFRATRMGLLPIPPSAEVAMVARDLVLLEEVGGRLHLAHLSCEASLRLVREAKRRGLAVTAEAAPHHFSLTDEAVEGYNTSAKMNPPLRQERDVRAVQEALANGTLDAIATDHAPHGPLEKDVEFDRAWNGVVGLETALPLTLDLVRQGLFSPSRAVELLSTGPARAFGLPGGHLGQDAVADIAVIDPDAEWSVDAQRFHSKGRNTPFQGRKVRGLVELTLISGRVVFDRSAKEPFES